MRARSRCCGAVGMVYAIGLIAVAAPGVASSLAAQRAQPGLPRAALKAMAIEVQHATANRTVAYAPLIRAGQSLAGELSPDRYHLRDGRPFELWTYQGQRDERVVFTAKAGVRIALLVEHLLSDSIEVPLDGSDTTETAPSVELKLPADGVYWIAVLGPRPGTEGAYTLSVRSHGSVSAVDWARLYPARGDPSERYALLVGVSDYPDPVNSLHGGPLNDVLLMRELLVSKYHFRPQNILILRDVEGNRTQIIEAFRRHLGQAGPNGLAVFYYSGHGLQMPDNRYIQDPEPTGKDQALAVWGTQGTLYGYILDDEMGILVGDLRAGRILVILDDCYAGNQTRGGAEFDWKTLAGDVVPPSALLPARGPQYIGLRRLEWRAIAAKVEEPEQYVQSVTGKVPDVNVESALTEPENHLLLAASADSEQSAQVPWPRADGRRVQNGVFTMALYGALMSAPPAMTFADAMAIVRQKVVAFTSQLGQVQTPQLEGRQRAARIAEFLSKRSQ